MNYEALVAMSVVVWGIVEMAKTPILHPLKSWLNDRYPTNGNDAYMVIVRLVAFALGFGYAYSAGQDGDLLVGLGATQFYGFSGWFATAVVIAAGNGAVDKLKNWLGQHAD